MVKFYPSIPPDLRTWALSQPLFFIASAPLSGSHINLSPKGLPASTFTIFSPNRCGYIDATGSGAETIAHIYENGRATVMFCSFETAPRIMRFFCRGRVVEYDDEEFGALVGEMGKGEVVGARAVVLLDVFKVCMCVHVIDSFLHALYAPKRKKITSPTKSSPIRSKQAAATASPSSPPSPHPINIPPNPPPSSSTGPP